MNEGRRKTALVIGTIAAAAGIAVASAILIKRTRQSAHPISAKSVSDVLNDCYAKMRDIQSHLSQLSATSLPGSASTVRSPAT